MEITFPKREIKETLVLILVMMIDHLVWTHCVVNSIPKYCLVIVYSYSFLDASTEGYEEEEVYEEEEEEHFDNCTNKGKLYWCNLY